MFRKHFEWKNFSHELNESNVEKQQQQKEKQVEMDVLVKMHGKIALLNRHTKHTIKCVFSTSI